jgi:hypothetical protein
MLAINLDTYETARLLPWILRQSALGSVSFLDSPMAGGSLMMKAYRPAAFSGHLTRAVGPSAGGGPLTAARTRTARSRGSRHRVRAHNPSSSRPSRTGRRCIAGHPRDR